MKKKPIVANIIWSSISLAISTIITIVLLPYISNKIGIEAYGYIALCNNIVSYIDLIASTINVYAVRFISIAYHQEDITKANRYYNSVLAVNSVLSAILVIPATFCIIYVDRIFDVPKNLSLDIRLLFAFTLINYIITIIGTVFSSAAFIKDILYKDTQIKAEAQIIRGVLMLAFFYVFFPHVWYVAVATAICSIFILIKNISLTRKNVSEFIINKSLASIGAIIEITRNGIWNTLASLGTTLNSGLDLLVTNFYLGAYKMGQLSVPKTLSTFVTALLTSVSNSFRPQLLLFYSQSKQEKLSEGFQTSMKFCGLIANTIFCVFFSLGKQFLNLWIPSQDIDLIYQLAVLTFLAEIFTGFVKPLHYGCVLTGKLKFPCTCNLIVGLFNVTSMIILLATTNLGIYIVVFTTIVGNLLYNFIIMPLYVTKIMNMLKRNMFLLILKYFVTCTLISGILFLLLSRIHIENWFVLMCFMAIATIISIIIYILLMLSRSEKKSIFNLVISKLSSIKDGGIKND